VEKPLRHKGKTSQVKAIDMYTSIDKAVAAAIMAIISIIALAGGLADVITEEWVAGVVAALTPIVVWLIPNRKT